jgi:hypothetical protein
MTKNILSLYLVDDGYLLSALWVWGGFLFRHITYEKVSSMVIHLSRSIWSRIRANRGFIEYILGQLALHTTYIVRNKHEKLEGKGEASFDTPFMIQSHLKVWRKSWEPFRFYQLTKGQLISKCPFGVIVWTKIPTKKFDKFCPRIWKVVKS